MPLAVVSPTTGVLNVVNIPTPSPGPGEVVIRVHVSGVAFHDGLIVKDRYQIKPSRPFSPGGEAAGVIAAVGDKVTKFRVGDRVRTGSVWGNYREEVVVKEGEVMAVQQGVPFRHALLGNYAVAHYALSERGGIKRGETLLVLGAGGGLGLAAVELGKLAGARVIAAASPGKLESCRKYGVETVDYTTKNFTADLKALASRGVDVVFDPVGGDWPLKLFKSIKFGGRYLVIGFAGGKIPTVPLNRILLAGIDVRGVNFMPHKVNTRKYSEEVSKMLGSGELKPLIHRVYRLEEAEQAIAEVQQRQVQGRIILETRAGRGVSGKL
eukprot:Hpha_TRINITY_DN16629_c1_g1::TRINITY_DN16629_c1_g1_i1::g.182980::m.182980/K00344/qor, CRYZ; NADPH2:quinone reductase